MLHMYLKKKTAGGAIAVLADAFVDITSSNFTGNIAVGHGGAVFGTETSIFSMFDSFVVNNTGK